MCRNLPPLAVMFLCFLSASWSQGFCCSLVLWIAKNGTVKKQSSGRNPLFAKRWFTEEVIVMGVRWY
jgi:hypothetical protein